MNTKRIPFQTSTLCAGGTLLILGAFLTLNLAGCGGGGGGIVNPTSNPNITPTPAGTGVRFQLQYSNLSNASGGTVRLTGNGKIYTGTANSSGLVTVSSIIPGTYQLVFTVTQNTSTGQPGPTPTPTVITTTRSITIAPASSGSQYYTLIQGDTGQSNPYTVTGRVILNPAGTTDPDGNSATANCTADGTPVTAALIITVRDLNSANGSPIIATTTRAAQASTVDSTQAGVYSISVPYQPRSFRVTVSSATDAPFAGLSALTSFPQSVTSVSNVDVCTNASTTPPQPSVTPTPSPTPVLTPTTIGTSVATATRTPSRTATPTSTTAATSTPQPTATTAPTNTPLPGTTPTSTPQPTSTTDPNAPTATPTATATNTSSGTGTTGLGRNRFQGR